jgi:hypothetical protein
MAEHIEFAGDFKLANITIRNHEHTLAVDIKRLVIEFNIYESMFANALTGTLVIADATNLIGKLPIQGTEILTFNLSTPGSPGIDCSTPEKAMHVYALTDKQQSSDGVEIYTLHFASREFLRNIRTRVSQAYSGRIDHMVSSIMQDENYLDSRKTLNVQETSNQDKIVIPNMHPFQAINMLQKRALSTIDNTTNVGYHFYETPRGFHFRSWESMCVDANGVPRDIKQSFEYMKVNMTDNSAYSAKKNKVTHEYQSVENYRFISTSHDVASNQAAGTYASRVISHNLYDKSYTESDYSYHNHYRDTNHVDGNRVPVVSTPVDFDDKGISDYPESKVSVVPTSRFVHGEDTGAFGIDVAQDGITESKRLSQTNQVLGGTILEMTIKGQSYLEVGDVVQFNLQTVDTKIRTAGSFDPQFSGRYIITKIRHRVTTTEYLNVIELAKDSVANAYPTKGLARYPGSKPKKDKGEIKKGYAGDGGHHSEMARKSSFGKNYHHS